jgi:hypothetical protein
MDMQRNGRANPTGVRAHVAGLVVRMRRLLRLNAALSAVPILAAACQPDVVLLDPDDIDGTGEIAISVVVTDPALAELMGVSPGTGVAGADVRMRRAGTTDILTFTADSAGGLALRDVPAARYWTWTEKQLDPGPSGGPPVLGGGALGRLERGDQLSIDVRGHQRGSLVISESYYHYAPAEVLEYNTAYRFYRYIEIANVSDTTIYLDGRIVGGGFSYDIDAPAWPCAETLAYRDEPRGLYSQSFQAFPGSGADYPLAAGGVAVIAEQAIDHSAIYPGLPDLRGADFQFYWEDRALNPDVPTMLPIQLRANPLTVMFSGLRSVPFIAEAVDLASLDRVSNLQGEFALFPRERILDMAVIINEFSLEPGRTPLCGHVAHPSLDALGAFVVPPERAGSHLLAAHRKLLPDGTDLQRTGVSAVDWERRARSPGRIP